MNKPIRHGGQQRFSRIKHRVSCDIVIGDQRHRALVTDLSANGLYVRTPQKAQPGSSVRLILHEPQGEVEVDARVAREHRMSLHHTTGTPSGLGLQIVAAPENYFRLIAELTPA
jgi:hypothetical protein